MLGDHGRYGKSVYYEASVRVPLIIAGSVQCSGRSNALVSLHDLAATFIDMTNAEAMPDMDARSLRPLLSGETHTHRRCVVSALNDWTAVIDGQHKLVLREDAEPILHDLQADPGEDCNIAPAKPDVVQRLRKSPER